MEYIRYLDRLTCADFANHLRKRSTRTMKIGQVINTVR